MKYIEFARDGIVFWAVWTVATISILFAPDTDTFPSLDKNPIEMSSARPALITSADSHAQSQRPFAPTRATTVYR
jgi:hypothetical protein